MKSYSEPIDPIIQHKIETLRPIPARDPQAAARGRAVFLNQAEKMAPAVSQTPTMRHKGWLSISLPLLRRKEFAPMFTPLITILTVITLLLGGSGVTVAAAQNSLPDQPLYGIKLASEEARLQLAAGSQNQWNYELEFATRRMEESRQMLENGTALNEAVMNRLQTQLDQTFRLTSGLNDEQITPALQQIQQRLQTQDRLMEQVHVQGNPQAEASLNQVRQVIQTRLQWAAEGLADPQAFRTQVRQRSQAGPAGHAGQPSNQEQGGVGPGPQEPNQAGSGNGNGPGPQTPNQSGSGNSYGPGPNLSETPVPGNGYGPGPNSNQEPGSGYGPGAGPAPSSTCTPMRNGEGNGPGQNEPPQGGYGPGPQATSTNANTGNPEPPGNSYGPGPNPSETPVPGSGYGPGPGPNGTYTPTPGSGYGPGPGDNPTQEPGSGNGSGPGPAPSSTCTPQAGPGEPGGPKGPGG